jgi:hypothetical protein
MAHDSPARRVRGQGGYLLWQPAPRRTEKKLWSAFRAGQQVDLRPSQNGARSGRVSARSSRAGASGSAVRARAIVEILCAEPRPGHHARLTLSGARITGSLDLSHARIEHPIIFRDCVFDEPVVLADARLGALSLDGSSFPGIDGQNLDVEGDLGLSGVSSSRTVTLTGAHLHRALRLRGAHLRCGDGQQAALDADHLTVDGGITANDGFEARGTVTMAGARVSGSVRLDGATITADPGRGPRERVAFFGDGMTVGHDFNAQRLTAEGEVRLVDVTIDSTLELRGATLANPGAVALRLDRAEIASSLYCDQGFTSSGEVCAIGAHVKGSVYLNHAELGTPPAGPGTAAVAGAAGTAGASGKAAAGLSAGVALRLVRTKIDGDFGCWEGFTGHGTLDLARSTVAGEFRLRTTAMKGYPKAADFSNAQFSSVQLSGDPPPGFLDFTKARTDFFRDSAGYWQSGDIVLDGFEYRSIQMDLVTVQQREQWLARAMEASKRNRGGDQDGYLPQPYDQLAAAYRRAGDDRAARRIQLAKYRQRNRVTSWRRWYSKLWNVVQDVVIGYGYEPIRAFLWLVGLFVLGVVLFRYISMPYWIGSGHRTFTLSNSVGYTLDLILPTSALQERNVWQSANGLGEVAAASLVIFGWVLTATVFAAAAHVLQRE